MMRAWAVVPAKSFFRAKSRLNLGADERARLAQSFLEHALEVLEACDLAGILVATDGDEVAQLAHARGAVVIRDRPRARGLDGAVGLANVVDAGISAVSSRGATHAVVLMSDLPRLVPGDVAGLLACAADAEVVASPDRRDEGTNALVVATHVQFPTCFGGGDSYARHRARARDCSLRFGTYVSAGLAWDVDGPEDLYPTRRSENRIVASAVHRR